MAAKNIFQKVRNSKMLLGETYFWTDTIKDWQPILEFDRNKQIIIDSLQWLAERKKIIVYGFVIMPNHIHLLWKMTSMNGKELPHGSFNKFTAHEILTGIKKSKPAMLENFSVSDSERRYRVWQRDPLAIRIDSEDKFVQKLNYIHENPLQEKWSLVKFPADYKWSSASFYELDKDDFGFLRNYWEDY